MLGTKLSSGLQLQLVSWDLSHTPGHRPAHSISPSDLYSTVISEALCLLGKQPLPTNPRVSTASLCLRVPGTYHHWKLFIYTRVTYLIALTRTRTSFKSSVAACRINKPSSQIRCILYNESFLLHRVIHGEGWMRLSTPRCLVKGKRATQQ